MSLHKITAGVGYDYLTRQVAAMDSSEKGHTGLASYYTQRGETPGVWVGSGMVGIEGLEAGDVVTAEQMQALFGSGHHPLARQRGDALPADATGEQIRQAVRLGAPFRVYEHDVPEFHRLVAQRCAEYNATLGVPSDSPVPRDVRAAIRSEIGRALFRAEHGRDPQDARELHGFIATVSRSRTTAVAGFDLTFSPVKSVSTLWALADPATAATIERAHHAAVADALRFVETRALFTRTGTQAVRQVDVRGLIGTAFTHRDSRAGDPDLHTHVAVANKVQTLDGRWLAIDGRPLYKAIVAASEVYNTALERHLSETLPVRFAARAQPDPRKRPVRELVGVDPALNARWSARRASIERRQGELASAFQADHGRPPTLVEARVLAQQATLETRQAKHEPRTLAEQRAAWRREAEVVLGHGGINRMLTAALQTRGRQRPTRVSRGWIREQSARIVATMEESRSTWQDWHVRAEALRVVRAAEVPGRRVDEVVARLTHAALSRHSVALAGPGDDMIEPASLRRIDGASVYTVAGATWHTSRRILAAEQRLVAAAGRTDGHAATPAAVDVALLEAEANRTPLNAGQAALVRAMATSGLRVQLAIAPAGSGKTTAMQALASAWRHDGGHVVGLAPSASAAAQLVGQIGTHADTLAILTHALAHHRPVPAWASAIGPRSLVVIDEAGMADTLTLDTVVAYVLDRGGSVRLIGDDQQLAAIGAGGVLRDIHHAHGALRLNELVRFTDPAEGAASLALRDGDPEALGFYLDNQRVHVGDLATCTQAVFDAWSADRAAGRDALMLAPTRDLVADLNARAQAALWGDQPPRRTVALPDGNVAGVGDLIITRTNDRRLATAATDWVRNGDRWRVTAIATNGALSAVHQISHQRVVLPADYVRDSVELGYACTVHTAQGVTADTMHGVLTGSESRQQLYTMLTRGRLANHVYLDVVGAGDEDAVIRPEAVLPPTAADLLEAVLTRDAAPTSATSTLRQAADPGSRLADAAVRYHDAVTFAAEQTAGPRLLADLDAAAQATHDGLLDAPAWPTLRAHLLLLAAGGTDPVHALRQAAGEGELASAADPAAVLDWRLDPSGRRNARPGPLPWLPGIPDRLTHHTDWADYLHRRHTLVTELADQVRHEALAATTMPAWAPAGAFRPDPTTLGDVAVWRAAHAIPDSDTRPVGPPERAAAERRHQRRLEARIVDHLAPAAAEWTPLVTSRAPATTGDPFLPVLAHRLAQISSVGLDAPRLLNTAVAEGVLPDEHPAAALWWRINRHLTPAVAARLDHDHVTLITNWLPTLEALLGNQRAHQLQTSPWWPALVTTVESALARGWRLDNLIGRTTPDADVDDCQALLWRTSLLLDPLPDEPDHDTDPREADLAGVPGFHAWADRGKPVDPETVPADPEAAPADRGDDTPMAPTAVADVTGQPAAHRSESPAYVPELDLAYTLEAAQRRVQSPAEPTDAELAVLLDRADAWRASPHRPERLAAVNALALDFFQACYPGSWAQPYLAGRFGTDLTGNHDVWPGYAPDSWTALVNHLRHRGVTDAELLTTGLAATASTGRLIDRFRDRVVFPIQHDGHVLGFVARRNPARPDHDPNRGPKYLNTPETLLFHKRAQLYVAGHRHLESGGVPVIVEGPADAVAVTLASAGRYVGVAPLGTSLTTEQARQLRGWGHDPIVATDNDLAGQAAAQRHYWILVPQLLQPRHAQLPDLSDPADLVAAKRPELLLDALDGARPLADTLVDERLGNLPVADAALQALPVIAARPVDDWEPALRVVAERTGAPLDALHDGLMHHIRDFNHDPARAAEPQLTLSEAVRNRLAGAVLNRRWAVVAEHVDPRLIRDPHWPELAGALELVNRIGHNPGDIMAVVLEDGPLDATRPAEDLTTRLRLVTDPHASAPNMTEPAATDDSGSELGRTLDRPSW